MNAILQNLALIHLNSFCIEHGVNISGTFCRKEGRGFTYALVRQSDATAILATVTFHKMQVPTYTVDFRLLPPRAGE